MSEEITRKRVQELVTRGPYHQWLGLKVIAVHDDGVELKATWREEWVVNPERRILGVVDINLFTDEVMDFEEPPETDVFEAIGFNISQVRNATPLRAVRYRLPWLLATIASEPGSSSRPFSTPIDTTWRLVLRAASIANTACAPRSSTIATPVVRRKSNATEVLSTATVLLRRVLPCRTDS